MSSARMQALRHQAAAESASMSANLPPGCTHAMIERHFACPPCDVCGLDPDSNCVCPPCHACDEIGDPACYEELSARHHGMKMTPEQHRLYDEKMQRLQEDLRR